MTNSAPWREQAFRYVAPVLGFLIGAAVLVVVWARMLQDLLPWWGLFIILAAGLALLLAAVTVGLLIGQRLLGERLEIALRDTRGRWRHGRVEIHGPRLTFLPYYWQVRIITGDREELGITHLEETHGRRPSLRELTALSPQVRIVSAETKSGPIEVAALRSRLQTIAHALTRPISPQTSDRLAPPPLRDRRGP